MVVLYLALAAAGAAPAAPPPNAARATASAPATVRILPGTRVHLGPASRSRMVKAVVRVEDGQLRPAYLIEFE